MTDDGDNDLREKEHHGFILYLNEKNQAEKKECQECGAEAEWDIDKLKCTECDNRHSYNIPEPSDRQKRRRVRKRRSRGGHPYV